MMGPGIYPVAVEPDITTIVNAAEIEPDLLTPAGRLFEITNEPIGIMIPAGGIDIGNRFVIQSIERIRDLMVVDQCRQNGAGHGCR